MSHRAGVAVGRGRPLVGLRGLALEREAIVVAAALMRAAWMAPWVCWVLGDSLVAPGGGARFPAWLVATLLLVSAHLGLYLPDGRRYRLLGLGVGLAALAGTLGYALGGGGIGGALLAQFADFSERVPPGLAVLVVTALVWWRGVRAAPLEYDAFFRSFLGGALALGLLMMVASPERLAATGLDMPLMLMAYAVASLAALAMIAVYQVQSFQHLLGQAHEGLSRYWLTALGTVIVLVLGVGWLLGWALAPGLGTLVRDALEATWSAVGTVLGYLLLAFGYVAFLVLAPLLALWEGLVGGERETVGETLRGRWEEQMDAGAPAMDVPGPAGTALKVLFLVVLAAGVVALLYFAYRRRAREEGGAYAEQRDIIASRDLLSRQLRSLLGRGRRRSNVPLFLDLSAEERERRRVRRLYQRFLARMRCIEHPRRPAATPLAYARDLGDGGPLASEAESLEALTHAYVSARYGAAPPPEPEVMAAERALDCIEQALDADRS